MRKTAPALTARDMSAMTARAGFLNLKPPIAFGYNINSQS